MSDGFSGATFRGSFKLKDLGDDPRLLNARGLVNANYRVLKSGFLDNDIPEVLKPKNSDANTPAPARSIRKQNVSSRQVYIFAPNMKDDDNDQGARSVKICTTL